MQAMLQTGAVDPINTYSRFTQRGDVPRQVILDHQLIILSLPPHQRFWIKQGYMDPVEDQKNE